MSTNSNSKKMQNKRHEILEKEKLKVKNQNTNRNVKTYVCSKYQTSLLYSKV